MRGLVLVSVLALLMAPVNSYAAKPQPMQSRSEEIEKLKGRLDKLEKMTDEEWQQNRDHNKERKELKKNRAKAGLSKKPGAEAPAEPAN